MKFEKIILVFIFANTILLSIKWTGMPEETTVILNFFNLLFVAVFTLEAIIKLIGLGTFYFKDGWNIFDLSIVIGSLVFAMIKYINPEIDFG
mmetsp:Transcript_34344/g.24842  ORF Transcript_34344/g.24842 Transcript_34344/m.24842 type:complete len:92 (+) Transcript_34344:134-409(+)